METNFTKMKITYTKIWKKTGNYILGKVILPIYNLFVEISRKDYCIISASITPFNHNWGDDVSPIIASLINPSKRYIINRYTWNIRKCDDILCIGSIITWMTTPRSIIWGSGVVYPEKEISAIPKKVLAVRGPLTRKYLTDRDISCPEIYGDPALLFPNYYQPQVDKTYKLGVIPHFRDKNNEILKNFADDPTVLIIDVQDVHPWHKFIDQICSCEHVATSSLHGLIISDAYHVPNVWIEFEGGESKRFAFFDYLKSVHREIDKPLLLSSKSSVEGIIETCQYTEIDIDLEKLLDTCPFVN